MERLAFIVLASTYGILIALLVVCLIRDFIEDLFG